MFFQLYTPQEKWLFEHQKFDIRILDNNIEYKEMNSNEFK
jgi:hypothetical protein